MNQTVFVGRFFGMISKAFARGWRQITIIPATVLAISTSTTAAFAQVRLYSPIPLPTSGEVSEKLTDKDIPTGQGGFARDYTIKLNKGDNLVIDLSSDSFDTIVNLLGPDGSTIAENDDGPDGTSNSQLFTRIMETGSYIVRVRSFGETGVGPFKLKVTRLKPVKE